MRITYPTSELDHRVRNYWLVLAGIAAVVLAAEHLLELGGQDGLVERRERGFQVLRHVLAARWLALPSTDGGLFALDTATISVLGWERDAPVVQTWNVDRDTP